MEILFPSSGMMYQHVIKAFCKFLSFMKLYSNITYVIKRRIVKEFPGNPCLGKRKRLNNGKMGDYEWETYKSVFEKVKNLGAGLRGLGIYEGDKVGIYSINRPEWIIAQQACYAHSFVSVPLYDTLGTNKTILNSLILNH